MKKYLIIGQGSIGKPVAEQLVVAGCDVLAAARSAKAYDPPDAMTVQFIQKDASDLTLTDVAGVTHIAIIVTPSKSTSARATADDQACAYRDSYLAVCDAVVGLAKQSQAWADNLAQVLFVSSTAVYGENGGKWINVTTPAVPTSATAMVLKQAEDLLIDSFGKRAVIVRASGIYGRGRLRLLKLAQEAAQNPKSIPTNQWTNRIMDTDLIHSLTQILLTDSPKPLYIATDTCPVMSSDVLSFITELLDLPPLTITDGTVSGKRIRGNVSEWLSFPSYREGYRDVATTKT